MREPNRRRAILYARVSTRGQARTGYSLAQQLEALREHASRAGYEVLEEVSDPGESGISLLRPGMDRVRDLVASGGVAAVLVQDLDRLARGSGHHELLRREFAEKGCGLEVLSGQGTGGRFAHHEQATIAERTQRGKLRKAREGKIAGGTRANYGFRFNAARDGYEVDEATMRVVGRIFRMVGVEMLALHAVKKALEADGEPTPAGGRVWVTETIRRLVLDDAYAPRDFVEVAKLVRPEVAAGLDPSERYGIWWFNRERWTSRRLSEVTESGRVYRRSVRAVPKPRNEWVAVPVPDSGVPPEVVDAAREVVRGNKPCSNKGDRFWELSRGILRCGECGRRMRTCVTRRPSRAYFYYACAKHHEDRGACPNRKSYRADALEPAVWRIISDLLADPTAVREGFESAIRRARDGARGDPENEANAWLARVAEADRARGRYQEMAARGLMSLDELGARLEEVENAREAALRGLEASRDTREPAEGLARDRDVLLESFAGSSRGTLGGLGPEERRRVYGMLRLRVLVHADGTLKASGAHGALFPRTGP